MVIEVENGIPMNLFVQEINKYIKDTSLLSVFDIGSRDGDDARFLKYHLGTNNVYAFEAHPQEYLIHKDRNRDINWINLAIYEYDGEIEFFIKAINSGIHSIRDRGQEFGTGSIMVPCKKMSTFLRENSLKSPNIVKVDVEGCSLEVLKSFENFIDGVEIIHMESECEKYFKDQYLQDDVFAYLIDKGFVMTMYSTTKGSNQHDSIWVHKSLM